MPPIPWNWRACCYTLSISKTSIRNSWQRRTFTSDPRFFRISEEVQQATSERRPVVALETTIYTHGFPYPENLELASRLESLVRLNGAVPATIGVLDGVARVGFGADELMRLASSSESPSMLKLSRRDFAFALGLRDAEGRPFSGGTTIAGTMLLAHMAGIKIFGTGGLGGVHRGAEQTMDISADLTELGRTPVTVISSGCKSFLDIPKTLEYLETQGVAVATFADGRSENVDFPAFYSRNSEVKSPKVLQDEVEAARVIFAHHALGLQSGLAFANPIPEQHSVPFEQMETAIGQALDDAAAAGASGAAITPYILTKIKEITGSKSVEANKALVEGNVVRASKVALALQKLEAESPDYAAVKREPQSVMVGPAAGSYTSEGVPHSLITQKRTGDATTPREESTQPVQSLSPAPADVFVAGSLAIDLACDYAPPSISASQSPEMKTSNPAQIKQTLGGVGHNVARAAHLMGATVRLCSVVGQDLTGKAALEALSTAGLSTASIEAFPQNNNDTRTAQYVAVNDASKDLVLAMADIGILETPSTSSPAIKEAFENLWLPQLMEERPLRTVLDANWPPEYLQLWLDAGKQVGTHITFEPVSNIKSTRLFSIRNQDQSRPYYPLASFPKPSIHLATPNSHELSAMYSAARENGYFDSVDWWNVIDALGIPQTGARVQMSLATSSQLVDQGIPQQSIQLLPYIPSICTKLGSQGVLLTQILPAGDPRLTDGDYAPHILSRCANETEDTLGVGGVYMRLFPPAEVVKEEDIISVNGVGDTFAGTLVAGLSKRGKGARVEDLIDLAQRAAVLTLKSEQSVAPGLGTLSMLL